jgi:3',5'-cyclic AMP phosphodiesterase CpdA
MIILAHLSDTHFGTERPEVTNALISTINHINPNIVIISGDLTQRAHLPQFEAAKNFLQSLTAELRLVIPGNHDIPLFNLARRIFNPYKNYSKVFGKRENICYCQNIAIIGYDATSRWYHTKGYLSENRLVQHIKAAKANLSANGIIIACAHQPLAVKLPQDAENILINAENVAKLFAQHKVDLVLSGHVHAPIITTTEHIFPNLARSFVLSGAGTAISHRTRSNMPNSFNLIYIDCVNNSPNFTIKLMEYVKEQHIFEEKIICSFNLGHNGWQL